MSPRARYALLACALGLLVTAQPASAETRSCGWAVVISGTQANVAFPDEAATYWSANLPMPPGGHVEIDGTFPHARYTSLTSYTGRGESIDGLKDVDIVPDAGSGNPFLPGAHRTMEKRDYTVRVVKAQVPSGSRAPNTLYTTSADGSRSGSEARQQVLLRIYEGDKGLGRKGGVPLPDITVVTADGERTTLPQCPDAGLPDAGVTTTAAYAGTGEPQPATGLGGMNPPVWHKFTNTVSGVVLAATDHQATGGTPSSVTSETDARLPSGGLFDNPDNKYVSTTFSRAFGQVLVFRAKAPTFPSTFEGDRVMGSGQLRYWSFCTNAQTTAYYACKQDDQIPVDDDGYYTIVVSTAAARPRNATEACGVAWVPVGPLSTSLLILRNMLPDPSFAEAIQNASPGTEAATLGEYYPRGTYYATPADFDRRGCSP